MTIQFLMGPVVGGVIGYFTNWLAIKMLFRPHQPKYFMGLHIPFTPGIIPKEKYRIAESVGKAISENLMNQEVLQKTLLSDEIVQRVHSSLREFQQYSTPCPELQRRGFPSVRIESIMGKKVRRSV